MESKALQFRPEMRPMAKTVQVDVRHPKDEVPASSERARSQIVDLLAMGCGRPEGRELRGRQEGPSLLDHSSAAPATMSVS